MSWRAGLALIALIGAITCVRVAATHAVFSPTWDEPAHIDMGYVYLTKHIVWFTEHPPLGRAVAAFPLRHAVVDPRGAKRWIQICASTGDLMSGVVASRRAMLVFVFIAIVAAGCWGMMTFSPLVGVLTSAVLGLIPSILAHGGLSTTDMALTAAFAVACISFRWWLLQPTWRRTLVLGIIVGIASLTKFSFIPFFGIAAAVMLVANKHLPKRKLAIVPFIAFAVIWAGYFGRHQRIFQLRPDAADITRQVLGSDSIAYANLPAAQFFFGILQTCQHDLTGHDSFFMGRVRTTGTWYYFPVLFAIKTPIPILAALAFGVWCVARTRVGVEIAAIAAALLLFLLGSRINIGIRHALPLYIPLAMVAAYGVAEGWKSRWLRPVVAALGVWLIAGSAAAHPDYLPWSNAFAGDDPAWFALDSNYDWGQDLLRLRDECRRRHITSLGASLFGVDDYAAMGLPPTHRIDTGRASFGWIAVSENNLRVAQASNPASYAWLTPFGYTRVGKSIRLYHLP